MYLGNLAESSGGGRGELIGPPFKGGPSKCLPMPPSTGGVLTGILGFWGGWLGEAQGVSTLLPLSCHLFLEAFLLVCMQVSRVGGIGRLSPAEHATIVSDIYL